MNPASNNFLNTFLKVEVLLDLGSNSNSFFYLDSYKLGVEVGDIVSVKLKGRLRLSAGNAFSTKIAP